MTDHLRQQLTAAWIALLVVGLVRVTAIETDYREKVSAFEFRLVIEKLQGNSGRVSKIADWRREARHQTTQWEKVAMHLAGASGIAAVALAISGFIWWMLVGLSIGNAGFAALFAGQALGMFGGI